jgi:hypothetical protein
MQFQRGARKVNWDTISTASGASGAKCKQTKPIDTRKIKSRLLPIIILSKSGFIEPIEEECCIDPSEDLYFKLGGACIVGTSTL